MGSGAYFFNEYVLAWYSISNTLSTCDSVNIFYQLALSISSFLPDWSQAPKSMVGRDIAKATNYPQKTLKLLIFVCVCQLKKAGERRNLHG